MPLVSEIGEFGLIDRLRALEIVQGIGDDCAVFSPPQGRDLVITVDALIEGVHFRHEWMSWQALGRKAMAVNLSDLAAMGAQPAGMLLTLGLKAETSTEDVLAFYEGAAIALKEAGAHIWGGDIVAAPLATSISVTAVGYVQSGRAVRRGGAEPGDELWVTGSLGLSALGLKALVRGESAEQDSALIHCHNEPQARVREGRAAAATGLVHAMMDISDGLAGDLGHMARESGVGAQVFEAALPMDPLLTANAARFDADPLDLALHGGEDYELLMAVEPGYGENVRAAITNASGVPLTRIGTVVGGPGITLIRRDNTPEPLEPRAFRHF